MHIFMREQTCLKFAIGLVDQAALADTAVVGFVVLESEVGDVIAQRV